MDSPPLRIKHAIPYKKYPIGLRGGIIDAKHYKTMKDAIWLFMWCVARQTKDANGFVLYGNKLTYRFIARETGFNERTVRAWAATLQEGGYIKVLRMKQGIQIRVLNSKKWIDNSKWQESATEVRHDSATYNNCHNSELSKNQEVAVLSDKNLPLPLLKDKDLYRTMIRQACKTPAAFLVPSDKELQNRKQNQLSAMKSKGYL